MDRQEKRHCQFLSPLQFSFNSLSYYDLKMNIIPIWAGTINNPRLKSYCFLSGSSIPGQVIIVNITLMLRLSLESLSKAMRKLRLHFCSTLHRSSIFTSNTFSLANVFVLNPRTAPHGHQNCYYECQYRVQQTSKTGKNF